MTRPMKSVMRVFLAVLALAAIAGLGFYLRPLTYFNAWVVLQEHFDGFENHSIKVEGYRMHYLAMGPASGRPVILVHGLGGHAEDWWNVAPVLAQAGFRVYMPDLIGFGRSQQPADFSYSVRDQAAVVLAFMDTLGLKQVDLGGWSMGGWIVQLIASDHPERVRKLMLIDSVGLNIKPAWDTGLFTPTSPQQLDQLDALLMPNPPAVPAFMTRDILRISRRNAWVIKRALASMMTAQDVTDNLLPQLKMPVLIVWGSLDRIAPADQAQIMHKLIPQSQLDVIPGCGHMVPLQCSAEMDPAILQFVG
ncbi:MAG: alpha/beta fold hydrolase [Terracidiphilus sp.]|jgi:pimeloyl-ACP methyl ester carboxylesterase